MSADDKPPTLRRLEARARQLAQQIDANLDEGVGFTLLLYTFKPGWSTYISNAHRDDMITALEDLLARWKAERETGSSSGKGAVA